MTLIDNGQTADSQTTTAAVTDVAPTIAAMQVSASREGEPATLSGTFTDPGVQDNFQLQVTWGDGQSDSEQLAAGATTFSLDHVYGDEGAVQRASHDYGQRRWSGYGDGDGPGHRESAAVAGRIDDFLDQRGRIRSGHRHNRGRRLGRLPSARHHLGRRHDFHLQLRGRDHKFCRDPPVFDCPARHNNLGPVRRGPDAFG